MGHPLTVIIDSESGSKSNRLIDRLIIDKSTPTTQHNGVSLYDYSLDTKYYSSSVRFCSVAEKSIISEEFAKAVEAVIVKVADNQLALAREWLSFVNEWEPEIKILVSDRAVGAFGESARHFCLENEFELVELDPDEETRQDLTECRELYGIDRILQILKSHSWPNAEMKPDPAGSQANMQRIRKMLDENQTNEDSPEDDCAQMAAKLATKLANEHFESGTCCDNNAAEQTVSHNGPSGSTTRDVAFSELNPDNESLLLRSVANGEDGDVSFEQLFAKFEQMKKTADGLPKEERKKYAEKVTLAFWRAIGGDDGEILGLGNSDSDGGDDSNNGAGADHKA